MSLPEHCHRAVSVAEASDLLIARACAAELAAGTKLPEADRQRFGLILTELATNLIRYGEKGGTMMLRRLDNGRGLECLCLDRGPGIADIGAALRDGGTLGQGLGFGLGAVRRLSNDFALHSEPGAGTAVLARIWTAPPPEQKVQVGAVMLPMPGETDCGDGWLVTAGRLIAVIDGLGHGPAASLAARQAEASAASAGADPAQALEAMHAALQGTRGAVAMVLRISDESVHYAGVGNVAAAVIGMDKVTWLQSSWGVVGSKIAPDGVHQVAWRRGDVLLIHTDGVTRGVEAFASRHLRYVDPTLAAAIVMRDATRKLDDQTVVVIRAQ